jgi:hypothetical protein
VPPAFPNFDLDRFDDGSFRAMVEHSAAVRGHAALSWAAPPLLREEIDTPTYQDGLGCWVSYCPHRADVPSPQFKAHPLKAMSQFWHAKMGSNWVNRCALHYYEDHSDAVWAHRLLHLMLENRERVQHEMALLTPGIAWRMKVRK